MSASSKPIKDTKGRRHNHAANAIENSGWEPSPAFDDWDAWAEIDRKAEAYAAAHPEPTVTPQPTAAEVGPTLDAGHGTGVGTGSAQRLPTDKQLGFLAALLRQLGSDDPQSVIDAMAKAPTWNRHTCSQAIDSFKAALDKGSDVTPAAAPAAPAKTNRRANKYAGACHLCKQHVDAEAGYLAGEPGAWTVEHVQCPTATVAAPAPVVEEGHYAIPSTGDNDLVFYRVKCPTEGKWAGRTFVNMVVGGHPDAPVAYKNVAGILARIAADPDAAARYGREIGRCYRCNRSLTDQTSRELGIGPECRKMEG